MNVILFDGVCNLCNGFVNFIIDHDKKESFKFASLQSRYAKKLLGVEAEELNSVIFFDGKTVFRKSEAVFEITKRLSKFKWIAVLRFLPLFLRDGLYTILARNRYRIFGKRESCRIPTPELQSRFLN